MLVDTQSYWHWLKINLQHQRLLVHQKDLSWWLETSVLPKMVV